MAAETEQRSRSSTLKSAERRVSFHRSPCSRTPTAGPRTLIPNLSLLQACVRSTCSEPRSTSTCAPTWPSQTRGSRNRHLPPRPSPLRPGQQSPSHLFDKCEGRPTTAPRTPGAAPLSLRGPQPPSPVEASRSALLSRPVGLSPTRVHGTGSGSGFSASPTSSATSRATVAVAAAAARAATTTWQRQRLRPTPGL